MRRMMRIMRMMMMMRMMTRCSGEWCCWGEFESEGREGDVRVKHSSISQWRCIFNHDGGDVLVRLMMMLMIRLSVTVRVA